MVQVNTVIWPHRPSGKTPFEGHFAGGPIVA